MERHGLVIVHTGDGKGKTTAAIGLAIRAWGNDMRVLVLQFIKGAWSYGELSTLSALRSLGDRIEVRQCGEGFTQKGDGREEAHRRAAKDAMEMARREIEGGGWDIIVLDEINYAVKFGLVEIGDVLSLIDAKPAELHLVLTGRDARDEIIKKADLVTEMRLIKHPFENGIKAQRGIEF